MEIIVIAEVREGKLKKSTFECLGAAKMMAEKTGGSVSAILIGKADLAKELSGHGAKTIYNAESDSLSSYSTDAFAAVCAGIIKDKNAGLVLCGATNYGKDLMPRIAAKRTGNKTVGPGGPS